jgi:hypothetical protein
MKSSFQLATNLASQMPVVLLKDSGDAQVAGFNDSLWRKPPSYRHAGRFANSVADFAKQSLWGKFNGPTMPRVLLQSDSAPDLIQVLNPSAKDFQSVMQVQDVLGAFFL